MTKNPTEFHNETSIDQTKLTQFQDNLHQIIRSKTNLSKIKHVLDAALKFVMESIDAPMGVINISDEISIRGIKRNAEATISIGLKIDREGFDDVIVVEDWRREESPYTNLSIMMNSLNTRASIISPIMVEQRRLGYLCIASSETRKWRSDEVNLVEAAGELLGKLVTEIHEQQEDSALPVYIQKFKKISGTLNRLLTFDEALTLIGQGAVGLFNAGHALIFLRLSGEALNLAWLYELSEMEIDQVVFEEQEEITSYITTFMSPFSIPDITKSGLPTQIMNYFNSTGIKSVRIIPLVFEDVVVGTIILLYSTSVFSNQQEQEILSSYANLAAITLQNAHYYNQLESGYLEIALALADAMDERETKIAGSYIQVANWVEETAQSMGCTREELDDIRWAALLHNIGKSDIPNNVIRKPGPLTENEWNVVRFHPEKAEQRVKPIPRFTNVGKIVRSCRERYDGGGYPDNLMGNDIPLGSRVIAVADAYSNMVIDRPYRSASTHQAAVGELKKYCGTQFDPNVVETFVKVIDVNTFAT